MKKKGAIVGAIAVATALTLCCTACAGLFETVTTPFEMATSRGYSGSEGDFFSSLYAKEEVTVDDSAAVSKAATSVVTVVSNYSNTNSVVGSGVIYQMSESADKTTASAYVITNYHVVYSATNGFSQDIDLYLYGSLLYSSADKIDATYVGGAMNYDIAVLKISDSALLKNSISRAVTHANSDAITVGDKTYAIGNPAGKGFSVSSGVVSVDAEEISILASDDKTKLTMLEIRTDAPINHGNSGGGLFNANGNLIGIVNARSEAEGVEQFGYAIPSNLAISIVRNIIDNEGSKAAYRATMGVTLARVESHAVYDETAQRIYTSETVRISDINGKPSLNNLNAGDDIYSMQIEGEPNSKQVITRYHQVGTFLFNVRKGDTLVIEYHRNGTTGTAKLTFDRDEYFTKFA